MVSTLDSESSDPGSNPGRTSFCVAPTATTTTLSLLRCEATHAMVGELNAAAPPAFVSQSTRTVSMSKLHNPRDHDGAAIYIDSLPPRQSTRLAEASISSNVLVISFIVATQRLLFRGRD